MKRPNASEVARALAESTLVVGTRHDGKLIPIQGAQWDQMVAVQRIEEAVRALKHAAFPLFPTKAYRSSKALHLDASGTGKLLLQCLRHDTSEIQKEYPFHEFNPYIREFFRIAESSQIRQELLDFEYLSDKQKAAVVDNLNAACATLKEIVTTKAFVTDLQRCQRAANKNFSSLLKYVDRHLALRPRLLVLRVGLGYANDQYPAAASGQPVSASMVRLDLKKMVRTLSEHVLLRAWRGFAYKFEHSLTKGFQIHLMLLLDGSKVPPGVRIAQMIGDLWQQKITEGIGTHANCSAIKNSHRGCGTGMIFSEDIIARENLYRAAMYMTKTDYFIAIAAPGLGKAFGRGKMPQLETRHAERPRRYRSPVIGRKLGG